MKNAFNYAALGGGFAATIFFGYAALRGMAPLEAGSTAVTDLPLASIGAMLVSAGTFCYGYLKVTKPPQP